MRYAYPCDLNPEEGGGFYVVFPDVRGALTNGKDREEALEMAQDALTIILSSHVENWEDVPTPSPLEPGQEFVALEPTAAAKLELYIAMREQGISPSELALRLDIPESNVHDLLILDRHTNISMVLDALRAIGCSMVFADFASIHHFRADSSEFPAKVR